jgi:hypothetical protein
MALPTFSSLAARRGAEKKETTEANTTADNEGTIVENAMPTGTVDVEKATGTRRHAIIAGSIFFSISVIFLILVRQLNPQVIRYHAHKDYRLSSAISILKPSYARPTSSSLTLQISSQRLPGTSSLRALWRAPLASMTFTRSDCGAFARVTMMKELHTARSQRPCIGSIQSRFY